MTNTNAQSKSQTTTAAERPVPVYQVLAEDIKALGIDAIFGLMSDDTAIFATALDTIGVRLYGARHENNAIAMAEAHAYATGKLAIALIGRGRRRPTACTRRCMLPEPAPRC